VHTLAQGGGGGGSSSSSYTVPVESGSESAPVAAIIKDDVVVVETISDSVINDVVEKGKTDTLTINLSGADDKVRGAVLDKETVDKISDVLNDKTNKVEALEIKTPTATITVDSKALNTISNAAGDGDSIRLVVEDAGDVTSELTSAQKKSIEGSNTLLMVDAYVLVGSTVIHNLGGGTITVTMEYPFDSSVDASLVTLTHMLDNGKAVQIPWKKVKAGSEQLVEFVTDSLSYFAFTIDEKAVAKRQNEKNGLVLNEEFKVRQYGSEIKVSWSAVDGADGYLVYATYCGTKFGKPVKTISNKDVTSVRISKLNGKALDLTGEFKVYVKAYKLVDGKKVAFGRTITAHIAGRKNKEYTNIQAIKVNTTRVSLKVGNTKQIKASLVLVNNVKSELNSYHGRQFRYASSDESVASVDKNGKITAKGSGTCYIYVYAKNGYARKIKVTVH